MIHNDPYFGISPRIACWKHISAEEIALAEKAENDMAARREYAEYYRRLDPEYFEKGKQYARKKYNEIASDFREMSFEEAYIDMVYCLHRYGFSFEDYCVFRLYTVSENGRKRFVSDKLRYYYYDLLNSPDLSKLMTNKLACYKHFKKYYHREIVGIVPENDINEFLDFIAKNDNFIYKPLADHSGHGVKIYSREDIGDPIEWYNNISLKHPGVVEQLITQSDKLNSLNPKAINTCRVVTFNTGETIEILAVTLRMGVGDSVTDNAGSGGIYACVDPETGIVITDAMNYKSEHYLKHPTTQTVIPGFILPEWERAKELVITAASENPQSAIISWDIASYTELGGG